MNLEEIQNKSEKNKENIKQQPFNTHKSNNYIFMLEMAKSFIRKNRKITALIILLMYFIIVGISWNIYQLITLIF